MLRALAFCVAGLALLLQPMQAAEPAPALAAAVMHEFPQCYGSSWSYEEATMLQGLAAVWQQSRDPATLAYLEHCGGRFVAADGAIATYKPEELSLDNVLMGRQMLLLYGVTGEARYRTAADTLYAQLKRQPRTPQGGFWHKQRYPNQMWLDGLYMAEPFYAQYAQDFNRPYDFQDIARQFGLVALHTTDPRTGLLFHGWDQSGQERWANQVTGDSPTLWSRGMGWYGMALVDTLDYFPRYDPARTRLIRLLRDFARAVAHFQQADGVWLQVTDQPAGHGNYEESSASAMFTYTLLKGARLGYLPAAARQAGLRGYAGLQTQFVRHDSHGDPQLTGTADHVGLGGTPYRDGSYAYYTGVAQVTDDPRGLGALLLAASEADRLKPAQSQWAGGGRKR